MAQNVNPYERLMDVHKDLYTPEEIDELFDDVSLHMVQHAVFAGDLPAIRDGDSIVAIHRADFLRWLRESGKY